FFRHPRPASRPALRGNNMTFMLSKRFLLLRLGMFAGMLVCLTMAAGCGAGVGTVTGTVTYKGKALTSGNVQIRSKAGNVLATDIRSDGTYSVPGVPTGPAQIAVSAMDPKFAEKMREMVGANKMPGGGGDKKMARAAGAKGAAAAGGALDRAAYSVIP